MKLKQLKLKNFRAYRNETIIDFGQLTAFVGKNDIGKSTILEALDIFFNEGKGIVKIDKDDVNKQARESGDDIIEITVIFNDLPDEIVIDETYRTNLSQEYLLNKDGDLEIVKKYKNGGKEKVYIRAYHPTNPACSDLLLLKNKELKKKLGNIECENKTINSIIRKSIWEHYKDDLRLQTIEIELTKEDAKNIWEKLKEYMPVYALFQSDRKNTDGDKEVQDPLKEAVKEILRNIEIQNKLREVADEVRSKLQKVAERTLEKLQEMNPEVANSLNPVIPSVESLKWEDVFKNVSIAGDEDIPINKRGSGVKRLILLNFFRAEAERRRQEKNVPDIIYAFEEPETSQHPEHQRLLIEAFKELSQSENTQVIITTHSPAIVKKLDFEDIRLIKKQNNTTIEVIKIQRSQLPYPSLNEINYVAFGEATEEYHNELYGYIKSIGQLSNYNQGKQTVNYYKLRRDGTSEQKNITKTEYIRHQIHHPENNLNPRYSYQDLKQSIENMRKFLNNLRQQNLI